MFKHSALPREAVENDICPAEKDIPPVGISPVSS